MKTMRRFALSIACLLAVLAWPGALRAQGPVRVQSSEEPCPRPAQLDEALRARLGPPGAPNFSLRYTATPDARLYLELVDDAGRVVLQRDLPRDPKSCRALADTLALVIERYLQQIQYRAPASPTPLPDDERPPALQPPAPSPPSGLPIALGVLAGGRGALDRPAGVREFRPELGLWAGLRFADWQMPVSLAMSLPQDMTIEGGGRFRLWTWPTRVGAEWVRDGRAVALALGLAAGLDVHAFTTRGVADARNGLRLEPIAELCVTPMARWRRWLFGLRVSAGVSAQPRNFDVRPDSPVAATPRVFVAASLRVAWASDRFLAP